MFRRFFGDPTPGARVTLIWATAVTASCVGFGSLFSSSDRNPEWLTAANWANIIGHASNPALEPIHTAMHGRLPSDVNWFRPSFPVGTTYDVEYRRRLNGGRAFDEPTLRTVMALAPYAGQAKDDYVRAFHPTPGTAEAFIEAFGEQVEYDRRVLTRIAEALHDEPARARYWYGRLCDVDPDRCRRMAEYLVKAGTEEEEVAAAYRRWIAAPAPSTSSLCTSVHLETLNPAQI